MRSVLIIGAALLATACQLPPKTADEFRTISRGRKGDTAFTVNAPLETVIARLTEHARRCNDFGWTHTRTNQRGEIRMRDRDRFLTRWENEKSAPPSFIVALEGTIAINRQEGGFFAHITDLERRGRQTSVTMYAVNAWGYHDWTTEFASAIKGERGLCHSEEAEK